MSSPLSAPSLLDNSTACASYFLEHEFYTRDGFLDADLCRSFVQALDETTTQQIPTDGGDVYEVYTCSLPDRLTIIAEYIGQKIAEAARKSIDLKTPSLHEVLKYNDGKALSMHRDAEGVARTKAIVTLSGSCTFIVDKQEIDITTGSLVVMRGRELCDVDTPLHGTKNNIGRRMLLVEPKYAL